MIKAYVLAFFLGMAMPQVFSHSPAAGVCLATALVVFTPVVWRTARSAADRAYINELRAQQRRPRPRAQEERRRLWRESRARPVAPVPIAARTPLWVFDAR